MRAIPSNSRFITRQIIIGTFIINICAGAEHIKTVGKSRRDPHQFTRLRIQNVAHPMTIGWRGRAHIHSDIKDTATDRLHQFPLGMSALVMQTAQGAAPRMAHIVLDKSIVTAMMFKIRLTKTLPKITALIKPGFWRQYHYLSQPSRVKFHRQAPIISIHLWENH
ncbi:hypothetical protein V428_16015 [Aeromonas hydrophila subsp. hydrophila AL09-71]|nr:hypothetical protein V428_16015 [Aeromonas hydrophila subsp. hydrophila AL09-71]AHX70317.1 hypothetical protein V429_16050 [Aeromonas hydrophila pc104A]ALQ62712.1 hypothetical protein AS145_07360 [Aeromonas hydrophila]ALZ79413.1 hypothetical protein AhyD4_07325 [Aeromonas hydrophila]AXV29321.1 hypothetical protein BFW97_07360 [Aeromonas hydrophila]